ncbi:MAG: hypothetical protein EBX41_02920, partial [Chitinophagia bacterium]|nr:hypothetical protein [Chitinophagia bacterium]
NYWLGTLKNGLYVLSENYPNSYVHNDAYTGNINYTYADNTNLFFVNSNNHIYRLQKNSINTLYKLPTDTTNPTTNLGHVILSHSNKSYSYLNIYNKSLTLVSDLLGKPQKTEKSVPEIETELMKSILNTKDRVYARTVNKIIDLSIDTGCKKCDNIKIHKIFENKERIFGFAKNKEDIWYSTVNGMYKIVKDSEQIASQFSKKNIAFKRFDFLKNGLVGYTYGNKLLVCTSFDSNLTVDTVKYQNCIWDKFYKIDNSHLLISTNDLYRIFTFNDTGNKPNFEITTLENQFIPLQAETIICDSNNCYFFKNGTVYRFTKQELIQKVHPPQIYFTTIAYGGKLRPIHNAMLMSYNSSKNITISFIASSFYGKNISYQFALTKNNAEVWQDLKGEEINLINPGYGAYKLKIRAKTASSGYCAPIEFAFTINKPFWAKWWFIALSILAVFILIFFGVRYRIYLELKKSEKEHEDKIRFLRSEYKALNALMNPHFIFNTLNNVQGLVNRNDKVAANEYLRIFADLVRQNMHNVSKELIPLQKEIELITNYLALEKLRFKELLNYAIEVDEDVDDGVIMVPPLIIQPLIENSIKHGILPMQSVNSRIDVLIYEKEDKLFIQVKDNGIGFNAGGQKKDPKHESYGLGNIKSRLHQLSIIMGKQIDFYFSEEVVNNVKWTVATITIAY